MVPVDFLATLRAYGYENEVPNVSATMGRLLHDLVLLSDTSRILELGTANGYSTIWMASALRELDSRHCEQSEKSTHHNRHAEFISASSFGVGDPETSSGGQISISARHCEQGVATSDDDFHSDRFTLGENRDPHASVLTSQDSLRMTVSRKLITVDVSEPSYKQAIENIEHVGLTSYVELNFGNALEFVPGLPDDSFDFAFIDARKKWTKEFLRLTWPRVKKGGIIIIDDVIKFREKMVGFYEYLEGQGIVYNVLPIDADDGCMMIIKP